MALTPFSSEALPTPSLAREPHPRITLKKDGPFARERQHTHFMTARGRNNLPVTAEDERRDVVAVAKGQFSPLRAGTVRQRRDIDLRYPLGQRTARGVSR